MNSVLRENKNCMGPIVYLLGHWVNGLAGKETGNYGVSFTLNPFILKGVHIKDNFFSQR